MNPHLARRRALLAIPALGAVALAGCGARAAAPPFDYTLLDGSTHPGSALRGHVVLVNFWATTCSVCVAEMPLLVATQHAYGSRGYRTLAVAMRHDPPALVADFAESRRLPFGVAIDNTGAIAQRFGNVQATPTGFLLDRRGSVARRWEGRPDADALRGWIESLLAESA